MHQFTQKDGTVSTVDRFMQGPKLSPGYWWQDRSPLGSGGGDWHEVVQPHSTAGTLFGYDECAFMARQYK